MILTPIAHVRYVPVPSSRTTWPGGRRAGPCQACSAFCVKPFLSGPWTCDALLILRCLENKQGQGFTKPMGIPVSWQADCPSLPLCPSTKSSPPATALLPPKPAKPSLPSPLGGYSAGPLIPGREHPPSYHCKSFPCRAVPVPEILLPFPL